MRKPEDFNIPNNVIEIYLSIDAIRTDRKTSFPLGYPMCVKPGKRLVISTKGIYYEDDHERAIQKV